MVRESIRYIGRDCSLECLCIIWLCPSGTVRIVRFFEDWFVVGTVRCRDLWRSILSAVSGAVVVVAVAWVAVASSEGSPYKLFANWAIHSLSCAVPDISTATSSKYASYARGFGVFF